MRFVVRVLLVYMILVVSGAAIAQEEDSPAGIDLERFTDIPMERLEDGGFVFGDPEAPVTVIEFADFLCPHCQDYEEVVDQFLEDYVVTGMARFEYRFMPIIDENFSPLMAAINECAGDEGLFWPAHRVLYQIGRARVQDSFIVENVAEWIGMDQVQLENCIGQADQFVEDTQLGDDLGVTGTPAIRVRIGDGPAGAIKIDGQVYDRGGLPPELLGLFVESENPEELFTLVNQLRNSDYLPDSTLVSGDPCEAPCWRGITPGETTWDEAVEILSQSDDIVASGTENSQTSDARRLTFQPAGGQPCCELITLDGETVAFLRVLTAPDVTLGEVIETHGEPVYLLGIPNTRDQAIATLFWPDTPMIVFTFVAGIDEGALSEESEVLGFQYVTSDAMIDLLGGSSVFEWDGFKTLADYMEGELITPGAETNQ